MTDNISIDEKSNKPALVNDISYKTLFGQKPFHIRFHKMKGFLRIYERITYLALFGPQNMLLCTIALDILFAKNWALHILFLIIMQGLKLILTILYL